MRGRCLHFNNELGYGFLAPDQGGDDIFVHYSAIQVKGYKRLNKGDIVEFETEQGQKGIQAANVRIVERAEGE